MSLFYIFYNMFLYLSCFFHSCITGFSTVWKLFLFRSRVVLQVSILCGNCFCSVASCITCFSIVWTLFGFRSDVYCRFLYYVEIVSVCVGVVYVRRFPVTTAGCVFGLRVGGRPAAVEGSCEYIE
jgi:hypothetical protein